MPTKQLFLAGYDDGHGFKIVDPATGQLLRQTQGSWWTDRIEGLYVDGQNLYALDTDSSLVRADLDGVVKAKIDIGYSGTSDTGDNLYWSMFVKDGFIYNIHKRNTDNPNPGFGLVQGDPQPTDSQVWYLVKRNKLTLAVVSETQLGDTALADVAGNSSYINNHVMCWQSDGFWVYCEAGPSAQHMLKVGFDGVPIAGHDIDFSAIGGFSPFNGNGSFWSAVSEITQCNFDYTGNWSDAHQISFSQGKVINFVGTGSVSPISDWSQSIPYMATQLFINGDSQAPRFAGGVLSFPTKVENHTFTDGAHSGQTGYAWSRISFEIVGGASLAMTTPIALDCFDMVPGSQNALVSGIECWQSFDADSFFLMDERKGCWLVNFTTGFSNFMQSYSSDTTEIDSGWMITTPYYTLSGTVTENDSGVARSLFVYDQETGQLITKTTSNIAGEFSVVMFTTSPKMVVVASADDTKNYKVSAHLTPA
jgi:hypothetical protein